MKTWSFFDLAAGRFTGRTYSGNELESNTPPGCEAREGVHLPEPDPAEAARTARRRALRRIQVVEAGQLRAMRELSLDPTDARARARLAEIDAEIAFLRASLPPAVE